MKIDLQHFAEEEEIELEEEIEEPQEEPEEPETEEPEEPEEKPKKDKVTAAVIREKQENKKLRDELAQLRKEKAEKEQAERDKQTKQKLLEDGLSEEEADSKIADRKEREELKRDIRQIRYGQQADKLSSKYPDIHDHLDDFIQIIEATKNTAHPMTLEKLCRAELDESSEQEIRTKAEQEALLNRQKAKDKQIVPGDVKTDTPVKLSADDERILSNINKRKQAQGQPLMSKKQYLELSKG